ncbi:MAG: TlpA disulfide reductase family protein [Bacteroidia bacterium]|nr:TlpA family protein disulfide reductase [Bacteroidia bacterium]MDW8014829.1 TlpA disulfide reductase family protein [Bacteroidia bacterium]
MKGFLLFSLAFLFAQPLPSYSWNAVESLLRSPDTLHILNFWSTWCRPCIVELPLLQAAYEKLKDSLPLRIWLVSLDFPPDGALQAAQLLKKHRIRLPALWLDEADPNAWIPRLNPEWDGALPYTQAGLKGPWHKGSFSTQTEVEDFVKRAYGILHHPRR